MKRLALSLAFVALWPALGLLASCWHAPQPALRITCNDCRSGECIPYDCENPPGWDLPHVELAEPTPTDDYVCLEWNRQACTHWTLERDAWGREDREL